MPTNARKIEYLQERIDSLDILIDSHQDTPHTHQNEIKQLLTRRERLQRRVKLLQRIEADHNPGATKP